MQQNKQLDQVIRDNIVANADTLHSYLAIQGISEEKKELFTAANTYLKEQQEKVKQYKFAAEDALIVYYKIYGAKKPSNKLAKMIPEVLQLPIMFAQCKLVMNELNELIKQSKQASPQTLNQWFAEHTKNKTRQANFNERHGISQFPAVPLEPKKPKEEEKKRKIPRAIAEFLAERQGNVVDDAHFDRLASVYLQHTMSVSGISSILKPPTKPTSFLDNVEQFVAMIQDDSDLIEIARALYRELLAPARKRPADSRESIGCIIWAFLQGWIPIQYLPKVTGMMLDMPSDSIRNMDYLIQNASAALELICDSGHNIQYTSFLGHRVCCANGA